eukprot:Rmarinus@m.8542
MTSSTAQKTKTTISLKGSTEIVTEFFGLGVNSILYQRGIYPGENFKSVSKYGVRLMTTTDPKLAKYLSTVMEQIHDWLMQKMVQKLVLVITSVETGDTLERWVFDIETDSNVMADGQAVEYNERQTELELKTMLRQITTCNSFLPVLDGECSFDLLIYTKKDLETPKAWEESDARMIDADSADTVPLRAFSTRVHSVRGSVTFRKEE